MDTKPRVTMLPITDAQVAAYERLETARMRLTELQTKPKSMLPLRERAALELATDLAIVEASAARIEWEKLSRESVKVSQG